MAAKVNKVKTMIKVPHMLHPQVLLHKRSPSAHLTLNKETRIQLSSQLLFTDQSQCLCIGRRRLRLTRTEMLP